MFISVDFRKPKLRKKNLKNKINKKEKVERNTTEGKIQPLCTIPYAICCFLQFLPIESAGENETWHHALIMRKKPITESFFFCLVESSRNCYLVIKMFSYLLLSFKSSKGQMLRNGGEGLPFAPHSWQPAIQHN